MSNNKLTRFILTANLFVALFAGSTMFAPSASACELDCNTAGTVIIENCDDHCIDVD